MVAKVCSFKDRNLFWKPRLNTDQMFKNIYISAYARLPSLCFSLLFFYTADKTSFPHLKTEKKSWRLKEKWRNECGKTETKTILWELKIDQGEIESSEEQQSGWSMQNSQRVDILPDNHTPFFKNRQKGWWGERWGANKAVCL